MKINHKIYNTIVSTPFDVQELEDGVKIELHSLNENEALFNEYAQTKGKFSVWSSLDGKTYRLLLEDSYYARLRELYGRRVNQCMITFWNDVEKERSKVLKWFFIISGILLGGLFIFLAFFPDALDQTGQMIVMGVTLVGFIVVNTVINKKVDAIINKHNSIAVEKIKNIVGHDRFEQLLDETRAHYDDFFGIEEEPETQTEEVVDCEKTGEEVTETEVNED